ncbi:RusA family crossover junction endodeoxyribonuclease [Lactobacillus salsicarnum]|nr:RusA family crossover junction endodeoxyribonuclease [Companilactobacillus mishanensis]
MKLQLTGPSMKKKQLRKMKPQQNKRELPNLRNYGGKPVKINLTIPGTPVPAARPRVTRWGTYTPPKYKAYKDGVSKLFQETIDHVVFEEGLPLKMTLKFYRPIQKTGSKKFKSQKANHELLPTIKPDLDNYIKAILDGLNGLAWHDDNQITTINATKDYDDNPRVEIEIEEIK